MPNTPKPIIEVIDCETGEREERPMTDAEYAAWLAMHEDVFNAPDA